MMDHDQQFKAPIRTYIVEFFSLFFPELAEYFDFEKVEWIDKEVFVDPPDGRRQTMDLVAKLPVLKPPAPESEYMLAIIHIEVDSWGPVTLMRPRMFDYFCTLYSQDKLSVLPIVLYLKTGLDGIGWDTHEIKFRGQTLVRFEYAYVGLPALNARE